MNIIEHDYFTYAGASRLKRVIENYWEKRGMFPAVRIERKSVHNENDEKLRFYVIRSDLAFDERGFPYVNRKGGGVI